MNTLKIGQHCPVHKGIYAGIARSFSSEPESHIILLDAKSPEEYMNWVEATTWAESLGEDTSLPTRNEAVLLGCNLAEELGEYGYVWTSTSDGARRAWFQPWGSSAPGSLVSICKTSGCRVRAVKRLPVTYEMKGHPLAAPAQAAAQAPAQDDSLTAAYMAGAHDAKAAAAAENESLRASFDTLRAGYDAARLEIESLQKAATDRHALQATGAHPAPCARYCEAQAFFITMRNLHAEIERLRTCNKDAQHEIANLQERVQLARDVNSRRVTELEAQLGRWGGWR